ncbi:hypothetical protein BV392_19220 [Rhodovulum sulfidophilum]|nr:hypothetical protein BV392_19220 [Rhodovulum sulfidophilum]
MEQLITCDEDGPDRTYARITIAAARMKNISAFAQETSSAAPEEVARPQSRLTLDEAAVKVLSDNSGIDPAFQLCKPT